jgi:hypothetical protein
MENFIKTKYMKEIRHMSVDITGVLRNYGKKSMKGLITEDNGAEWTDVMVRKYLNKCLAEGKKLLPIGDCEGFDYQKGCPGHPVKEEL